MKELSRTTSADEIEKITGFIHDDSIDEDRVAYNSVNRVLEIGIESQHSRVKRKFWGVATVPLKRSSLRIYNAIEYSINDPARVAGGDLERVFYNNKEGNIVVETSTGFNINVNVSCIEVEVEITDEIIGQVLIRYFLGLGFEVGRIPVNR